MKSRCLSKAPWANAISPRHFCADCSLVPLPWQARSSIAAAYIMTYNAWSIAVSAHRIANGEHPRKFGLAALATAGRQLEKAIFVSVILAGSSLSPYKSTLTVLLRFCTLRYMHMRHATTACTWALFIFVLLFNILSAVRAFTLTIAMPASPLCNCCCCLGSADACRVLLLLMMPLTFSCSRSWLAGCCFRDAERG